MMMSLAMLMMAPIFTGTNGLERAVRWIFTLSFVLTVVALLIISQMFGIHREYRFEVAVISIVWLAVISGGVLVALVFKRALKTNAD